MAPEKTQMPPDPGEGGGTATEVGNSFRPEDDTSSAASWRMGGPGLILNEHWRVTFDPLQWILERRSGSQWKARSFCVTKAALLRCIREYCGEVDLSQVLESPDWHPDRRMTATKASPLIEIPADPVSALPPTLKSAGEA